MIYFHRVPLPYAGIDELKNINFQVSLNIYVACREDYRADLLVEELDNKFTKSGKNHDQSTSNINSKMMNKQFIFYYFQIYLI